MSKIANKFDDLCKVSAIEVAEAYSIGALSPVEVTKAALARAESINTELNAFTIIDHQGALEAAKAAEKRWASSNPLSPIDGITTTIKDIVTVNGLDVRYGSKTTHNISNLPDAPSVQKLRENGAVILGLTTTPEFGWKATTDSLRNGITRNPWDRAKTSGGSSGGAGVAAATGAGILHLGTDGGGSVRIPASFCGIVGYKPTFGTVPAFPASAFGTVAHVGPMARTVKDVALMLNAMSGNDIRDWNQPKVPYQDVNPASFDWKDKRIGYWDKSCYGDVDPEVAQKIDNVIADLKSAGSQIEQISLPHQDELADIFDRFWLIGAATRLEAIEESRHCDIDQGFLEVARRGREFTCMDRMNAEISRANYGIKMDALLEEYDFIISPTWPVLPADAEVSPDSVFSDWIDLASFTYPINLSQQPAISVPCGLSASGLPIGLQIIGGRYKDNKVLSAALTYQEMYPDRFLLPENNWPDHRNGAG